MSGIHDIITQHAEEAAFNWLLRDSAVHAPHYDLKDLAELDDRVEAHIDGLRIAGDAGWELCKAQLMWEEPGEVFAASVLALENGAEDRLQTVFEAAIVSPETVRGLVSAFGWEPYPKVRDYLQTLTASESPDMRRIGIAACAINRWYPGKALAEAFSQDDSLLKARALKAVGEIGLRDMLPSVRAHFTAEDEKCRFYAAWSAALLRDSDALPVLGEIAETGGPYAPRACFTALRLLRISEAHAWLKKLASQPEHQRMAVMGAGVLGDPVLIPWLIQQMESPELARVAGESFSVITGADIADEDLEGEWPEGFEAGPTEAPEDEDVDTDPDEDLPWPDPERILTWWHPHKKNFQNSVRYFSGRPVSEAHLRRVLRDGFQRQRAAAAIELAMIKPGQPLFEVRGPGFQQQILLGGE
ncbi:hypothetical protein DENIS_3093 [Desulfonema ishimotonii]|uniref:TIGR02270 family protein n=1 Tax=Desulfonema ishimotonii TaxID=45657 RepID=A0A401FYV8_9BACT|nr:TIGR02270 family protein [Desulfonema ishimotonii]GBC62130.1 hypothetical protein DENIS_3093 [Desulfonema ishimotonii]